MCGICGIVSLDTTIHPSPIDLEDMKKLLTHRGPDVNGSYNKDSVLFGHTRLSIIDLSENGNQPMSNEDGNIWVVFNGEIYNFPELMKELVGAGHRFSSRTDTEVVIHAYEQWGTDCLERFEGAFAFVIWDGSKQQLFAARDRFGEKPFFYCHTNGLFFFASELAPLLKVIPQKSEIDPVGLDLFLSYLFIAAPYTIFKHIKQLEPAHFLLADRKGNFQTRCYWKLSFAKQLQLSAPEINSQVRDYLKKAVSMRLVSDVPVGVLLSGGVDSAAIVASMKEVSDSRINTFSIGTTDPKMNELDRARMISKLFGTNHKELIVEPNAIDVLPTLVFHYGQPYADSSAIPSYYVSIMAHQYVKVALSGDGGDEMFAGYDRYRVARVLQTARSLPLIVKQVIKYISQASGEQPSNIILRRLQYIDRLMGLEESQAFAGSYLQGFLPKRSVLYTKEFLDKLNGSRFPDAFADIYLQTDGATLLDRWINADILTMLPGDYLTKVDIASMACSLEVRAPYLDSSLANFMAKIPSSTKLSKGKQKAILKAAFRGILPDETLDHKKTGFSVPVHLWLRDELSIFVDRLVLESKSELLGTYLQPEGIKQIVLSQRAGDNSLTTKVWALLNLVIWEKILYCGRLPSVIPRLQDII